eukprot:14479136-Ditylum_brightwellii.AAC.1
MVELFNTVLPNLLLAKAKYDLESRYIDEGLNPRNNSFRVGYIDFQLAGQTKSIVKDPKYYSLILLRHQDSESNQSKNKHNKSTSFHRPD